MYGIEGLIAHVRDRINSLTRTNLHELGLSADEFKKRDNKRAELRRSLKHCAYGSARDKQYVKDFILDMLDRYIPDAHLNLAVPFNRPERMASSEVFACLLYDYRKEHGTGALTALADRYNLDRPKPLLENGTVTAFVITENEIRLIYDEEGHMHSRADKLEILSQMVYERYKGLGVVDELRDMDVDGLSAGVSGMAESDAINGFPGDKRADSLRSCDSVWMFYHGKSVRLACLGFGSDKELRRVCQNIYRYNKAGQLSESNGFRISEMRDGSRVVVVRPPFSESWAFFVRKFQTRNISLERLITGPGAELPISFIRYLAKGAMITAVTGSQGSGKTTLLMEMIRHIDASHPLRIQEMAFELHLRRLYPERNILSFRETETISGQAGLDLQKKTDGAVNILGEVATDEVSAWMIQMAQVASLFTLFTHHAKTTRDLVLSLRNSLLKCEMFNNETIAEQQVVSVLDFDIHLAKDVNGHRYVERITEIVGTDADAPYPGNWRDESEQGNAAMLFQHTTQSFFERMTDRKAYESRNIIEYRNGAYAAVHRPSAGHAGEMAVNMREADAASFLQWLSHWWPLQTETEIMRRKGEADAAADIVSLAPV
jgi:pilus assembly protein CpaF